ncbi:exported hypothetical protein [Thiomonas arsenitoxydans]|uniref:Uncharacterized protein n=1 Tax=Thiomonas arsenitoxydans (strain DSM 22701 / CIP 110005 / 3As) TaxID=426114 RepID=A0ABP1YY25_THIA3|nr:exported hypothetical protein [Thiomonas arsenitoxydans]CQR30239.1 exported hypothetical protein [Thiomonas arsenitoxydans]CQR32325.1 exported hypothetical protein [Thiomonas arsenitoxydans]
MRPGMRLALAFALLSPIQLTADLDTP